MLVPEVATDPYRRNRLRQNSVIFIGPGSRPESKICEKLDQYLESLYILGSSRSLHDLYKCLCLCRNVEFLLHRWLPQCKSEKIRTADQDSKILEQELSRSLKMWLRPPLTGTEDLAQWAKVSSAEVYCIEGICKVKAMMLSGSERWIVRRRWHWLVLCGKMSGDALLVWGASLLLSERSWDQSRVAGRAGLFRLSRIRA